MEWKKHRWQKMNTKFLTEATEKQLLQIEQLSDDVKDWDVYDGLVESISSIHNCVPLIDNLSNPAMRTRHWKQLVRVTGGVIQVDNETLKRMTLGEVLNLGLQSEPHYCCVELVVQFDYCFQITWKMCEPLSTVP